MAQGQMPPMKTLTKEEAKGACKTGMRAWCKFRTNTLTPPTEVMEAGIALYDEEGNKAQVDAAVAAAEGDQMKLMMTAMPVALAIGKPLLEKYGFTADPMGVMALLAALTAATGQDAELAEQFAELRKRILPGM